MSATMITGAAGAAALMVAIGGTVWASSSESPAASSDTATVGDRLAGSARTDRPTATPSSATSARDASTTGTTSGSAGTAQKPAAAAKGTVRARVASQNPTGCGLLYAYRVVGAKRTQVAMFGEAKNGTVSGKVAPGRYAFELRDDCDTDRGSVWVGGTSKGDARVFTVRSTATTNLGTIALVFDSSPSLALRFVSAVDGSPVVGEPFDVYDEEDDIVWSWGTDSAGRIQTTDQPVEEGEKNLPPGNYRFRVAGNDFEQIEFTVSLQSDVARTYELQPVG